MKDLKIGDKFLKDGVIYIIEESKDGLCHGCAFYLSGVECFDMMDVTIPFCTPNERCDGRHVIFKEEIND
ncbi:MAG: hypothetical protein ACRC7S_07515 [Cetobacterium sp.]